MPKVEKDKRLKTITLDDAVHPLQEAAFLEAAIKEVGGIVVVSDLQGRVVFVNSGIMDALLLQPTKIIKKNIGQFLLKEDKTRFNAVFEAVVKTGFLHRIEVSWLTKYRTQRLFDCAIGVIRDLDGEICNVILTGIDITERRRAEAQLTENALQFRNLFTSTIHVLSGVIDKRDPYTAGHQLRVAKLASAIGTEMGLDADRVEGLYLGGLIHDIGKISVPSDILSRPGRLNEMEYGLIKYHPSVGFDIVAGLDLPWPIKEIIIQHHERLDGSGYPNHCKGDEIILEARIVAVSDVVEAISSHRPYRAALGIEAGLKEIRRGRGVHYDKDVVKACLRLFKENRFEWPSDPMRSS